jgi:hypothetical protein
MTPRGLALEEQRAPRRIEESILALHAKIESGEIQRSNIRGDVTPYIAATPMGFGAPGESKLALVSPAALLRGGPWAAWRALRTQRLLAVAIVAIAVVVALLVARIIAASASPPAVAPSRNHWRAVLRMPARPFTADGAWSSRLATAARTAVPAVARAALNATRGAATTTRGAVAASQRRLRRAARRALAAMRVAACVTARIQHGVHGAAAHAAATASNAAAAAVRAAVRAVVGLPRRSHAALVSARRLVSSGRTAVVAAWELEMRRCACGGGDGDSG